jgi:hypothetical protein
LAALAVLAGVLGLPSIAAAQPANPFFARS